MPPPSQLSISTSSLARLLKEEVSYHKEAQSQQTRVSKIQQSPPAENADFILKQERQALQETKDVLVPLRQRIDNAKATLEHQIAADESSAPSDVLTKAREVLAQANASSNS